MGASEFMDWLNIMMGQGGSVYAQHKASDLADAQSALQQMLTGQMAENQRRAGNDFVTGVNDLIGGGWFDRTAQNQQLVSNLNDRNSQLADLVAGNQQGLSDLYGQINQNTMAGIEQNAQQFAGVSPTLTGMGNRGLQAALNPVSTYDVTGRPSQMSNLASGFNEEQIAQGYKPTPGFDFRMAESEKAINRAHAAQGGRFSTSALQDLQDNAQSIGASDFSQYMGQQQSLLGQQAQLQGAAEQFDLGAAMNQAGRQDAMNLASQQLTAGQGLGALGANAQLASGLAGQQFAGGAFDAGYLADLGKIGVGTGLQYGMEMATSPYELQKQFYGQEGQLDQSRLGALAQAYMAQAGYQAQPLPMPDFGAGVPYAGAGFGSYSQGMNNAANVLASLYGQGVFGGGN